MAFRGKVLNAFKLQGLVPTPDSIKAVCQHVSNSQDELGELTRILQHLKGNAKLVNSKVTIELVEEAIQIDGEGENEAGENIMVIDHGQVPISVYDTVRQSFHRLPGSSRSIFSGLSPPFNRIHAFRERFEIIEQRTLRNKFFAKRAFQNGNAGNQDHYELTRISGIRRATGDVKVLGLLTQPQEGVFHLEDTSHSIPVDLSEAEATLGLFTENCVIIVQGTMERDTFKATVLAMPPVEDRKTTCETFPLLATPTLRKPYSQEEKQQLLHEEQHGVHSQIVVLSDVWLDRPKVMRGLKMMFLRYNAVCEDAEREGEELRFLFVLMGNFTSKAAPTGYATHRELFDQLGALLAAHTALLQSASFIFIPGPNDVIGGNGLMLPRAGLPDVVSAGIREVVPASSFAADPCRVKFCSQELLFHRDDLCARIRKYSRSPGNDDPCWKHAVKTVLCQAHLCPLPLHAAPINWSFDHELRLYPLPDLLVLGDRVGRFDMETKGTSVANPGCFAADFTFYTYTPGTRELEPCALEVEELEGEARPKRVGPAKKKEKKRRLQAKDGREEALAGHKTPQSKASRVKTPPTRVAGGIRSFFSKVDPEERWAAEAEGRRRRVRQRAEEDGGSEAEEEEEDSSAGEEEEQAGSAGEEEDESGDEGEGEAGEEQGEGGEGSEEEDAVGKPAARRARGQWKRRRVEDSDDDEAGALAL